MQCSMETLQTADAKLTETKDGLESRTASTESLTARITSETLVEEQLKLQDADLKQRKRALLGAKDEAKERSKEVAIEIDDFNMLRDSEIDALQKRIANRKCRPSLSHVFLSISTSYPECTYSPSPFSLSLSLSLSL